jgi:uncharacterized repeat protein (TIGR01451 family)
MGTGYQTRAVTGVWGSLSKVVAPYSTSIVTQASTLLRDDHAMATGEQLPGATTIELTTAQRQQANQTSRLWVQGGTPTDPVLAQEFGTITEPEYGFGTLRCATDNLNGDNVEYIYFPVGVTHVFCYAYYVKPPPTSGTITIKKQVVGAPPGERPAFPFSGDISFNPGGFQLADGASIDFFRAGGLAWTVTEGAVDNFVVASINCHSAEGTSTFEVSGPTATINLAAKDHVTCVYTNRYVPPSGGLTVTKLTRGGVGTFSYKVAPVSGGETHTVKATTKVPGVPVDAEPSLTGLAPGSYQITEHAPTTLGGTWRVRSVECSHERARTTRTVEVTIHAGEEVTCVFTNTFTPHGSISLAKITEGATGKTNFLIASASGRPVQFFHTATTKTPGVATDAVPNTPADATDRLRLGEYRIIEQAPASTPANGWMLTSVRCNGLLAPFAQGGIVIKLTRSAPAVHCIYTDTFSHTPPPEPPPQPPAPPTPGPPPPQGPDTTQPSEPYSDLAVAKHASRAVLIRGDIVTYRITVTNHGPDDAARVVLGDQPRGPAVVVAANTSIGRCQVRLPITCYLGTLKPGVKAHITIRLRVTTSLSASRTARWSAPRATTRTWPTTWPKRPSGFSRRHRPSRPHRRLGWGEWTTVGGRGRRYRQR